MKYGWKTTLVAGVMAVSAGAADAAILRFEAISAAAGSLGWLTLDSSVLDGTAFQFVYGTDLLDLMFTDPATLQSYDASDIDPSGATIFDSSGAIPTIVGGSGDTAGDYGNGVWIYGTSGAIVGPTTYEDIRWVTSTVAAVPLPAGGLLLLGGIGALSQLRRRKKAA